MQPKFVFGSRLPLPMETSRLAVPYDASADSIDQALLVVQQSDARALTPRELICWQRCYDAGLIWKLGNYYTETALYLQSIGTLTAPRRSYSFQKKVTVVGAAFAGLCILAATMAHGESVCVVAGSRVDCRHFLSSDSNTNAARLDEIARRQNASRLQDDRTSHHAPDTYSKPDANGGEAGHR